MGLRRNNMFYSKEVMIGRMEQRINILRARGEEMNKNLINALIRQKRNLEESYDT